MPGFGTRRKWTAARRRHIVRLQQKVQGADDDRGKPTYTWTDVISDLPAAIEPLTGSEAETARQLYAFATYQIEIHADSRVTPQMRILHGTREFYIGWVHEVEESGRSMILLCSENVE